MAESSLTPKSTLFQITKVHLAKNLFQYIVISSSQHVKTTSPTAVLGQFTVSLSKQKYICSNTEGLDAYHLKQKVSMAQLEQTCQLLSNADSSVIFLGK